MELCSAVSSVPCLIVSNKSTWTTAWTCLQRSVNFRQGDLSFALHRYVFMKYICNILNWYSFNRSNHSNTSLYALWLICLKQNSNVNVRPQNVIIVSINTYAKDWLNHFFFKVHLILKRSFIWTNLNPLHPKMFVKCLWNLPSGSGEKFKISSVYF